MQRLRLVLMVREDDGWNEAPPNVDAVPFASASVSASSSISPPDFASTSTSVLAPSSPMESGVDNNVNVNVLVSALPPKDALMDAWSRNPLQSLEIFVEIGECVEMPWTPYGLASL